MTKDEEKQSAKIIESLNMQSFRDDLTVINFMIRQIFSEVLLKQFQ